jgi:hypothetical protein
MKIINNFEDWAKYYPSEEAEIPESVTLQIRFEHPSELKARDTGLYTTFMYDEENTYFETSGAAFNEGGFIMPNKRFTDLELYELVYHMFNLMLKEEVVSSDAETFGVTEDAIYYDENGL